jgi:hypothetical protein
MPRTLSENFTLGAGNTSLSSLLRSILADFPYKVKYSYTVESGGPVARGNSSMAAVTDGAQKAVGEGHGSEGYVDSTKIYFRPTAAGVDVIHVEAESFN